MAIPDYQTLMLPLLRLTTDGHQTGSTMPSKVGREFGSPTGSAPNYCRAARHRFSTTESVGHAPISSRRGLLRSPKGGVFQITEAGRALLENPRQIDVALLDRYEAFRNSDRVVAIRARENRTDDQATSGGSTRTRHLRMLLPPRMEKSGEPGSRTAGPGGSYFTCVL